MTELMPLHALNITLLLQEHRAVPHSKSSKSQQPGWTSRWQQLCQRHARHEQPRLSPFYRA